MDSINNNNKMDLQVLIRNDLQNLLPSEKNKVQKALNMFI